MRTNDKIIEAANLTKVFKDVKAVDHLSLNVYRGNVFGFLGPNGAGKSTTIRMLLTLVNPGEGEIKIFGKSLKNHSREILKNIGAIVEKPDFYKYLSAFKNLEILAKISGKEIKSKRIFEVLELVGLKERSHSKVKTFSHGMKQRLGIAQALVHDPELIILDEPTTGLDPQGMKEIRDLIHLLSKEQKKTIFLSSHLLSEVEQVADHMIIINKGKTIVEGEVSKLLEANKLTVKFEVDNIAKVESILAETKWQEFITKKEDKSITFSLNENQIPILNKTLVDNEISVSAIIPSRSLEEYFLKITEEAN